MSPGQSIGCQPLVRIFLLRHFHASVTRTYLSLQGVLSCEEMLIAICLIRGGGTKAGADYGLIIGIGGLLPQRIGFGEAGNITMTSDDDDFGSWIEGVAES